MTNCPWLSKLMSMIDNFMFTRCNLQWSLLKILILLQGSLCLLAQWL